jgi:tRNA 2-selenouridine synthase
MTFPEPESSAFLGGRPSPIRDFQQYAVVIDARSPREFAQDHVPCAINLPVAGDAEYAEVGTLHKADTHAAYLLGVEYSLVNIAKHIKELIARLNKSDRILVYCFRGGKRSKLWADTCGPSASKSTYYLGAGRTTENG